MGGNHRYLFVPTPLNASGGTVVFLALREFVCLGFVWASFWGFFLVCVFGVCFCVLLMMATFLTVFGHWG